MPEQKIDVLNLGHVTLIDSLGDDLTVVNSARVSYGNKKSELDSKDVKLIEFLVKNKHDSPFRHVQIQFRVKAPEFVMRQWYKHVVGIAYTEQSTVDHAWNEVSGRYIKCQPEFYIPDIYRTQSKTNKQATTLNEVEDKQGARSAYLSALSVSYKIYEEMLDKGVGREIARSVLPLALYTEVIWTASLQAVLNFISLRDHDGAQWEIREYAQAVRELVSKIAPHTMKAWDEHRS